MQRFFRQLRRQLLGNQRLSSYFLYALGEMVLVIFGILIALKVNDYRETLNQLETKRQLLAQLAQENRINLKELAEDQAYRDTLPVRISEFHAFLRTEDYEARTEALRGYLGDMLRGTVYTFGNKYLNKYMVSYAEDSDRFAAELTLLDSYQNDLEYISKMAQDYKLERFYDMIVGSVDLEDLSVEDYTVFDDLVLQNNLILLSGIEQEVSNIFSGTLQQQEVVDSLLRVELK